MYDVVVIGAGPAGVMTSIKASERGLKVLLIEKNNEILKKLKLTGGGRCNITNLKNKNEFLLNINNKEYFSNNFDNFSPKDIVSFFEKNKILLKEEDNNKIFPVSNSALEIIDFLKKELKKVDLSLNTKVEELKKEEEFIIKTDKGEYKSLSLVIATGGKSYPNTGSTGDGYRFASFFGHKINKLYPAETYIKTKENINLSGVSILATIKYREIVEKNKILFTHFGLSGPGIYNISTEIAKNIKNDNKIIIDFLPNIEKELLKESLEFEKQSLEIKTWLKKYLPISICNYILKDLSHIKIASISKKNKLNIIEDIKNMSIEISGVGDLETSIVTNGGVTLDELDSLTNESLLVPDLYFCGEVMDLVGKVGGYNLTIAFSTGYTVGLNIKKRR